MLTALMENARHYGLDDLISVALRSTTQSGQNKQPYLCLTVYLHNKYSNDANMKFNIMRKTTAAQKKLLDDEKIVSLSDDITITQLQTLMIKNRTLALADPMAFVAMAFQVTQDVLQKAITVHKCKNGFHATVDGSIFARNLVRNVRQISDMREERHLVYNLKH